MITRMRSPGRTFESGQPGLKFGNAGQSRCQLPDQRQQRQDERILLRDGQPAEVDFGHYTEVESSRP